MKISACVIVKNEEKNLPQWLDCVRRLADEIVVVDTGSTDRTVELAQEAGVNLYHFEWIKDFAAAKNYALDQATGEWIVFLDADEYFPPEDCPRVLELIRRYHPDRRVGGFLCRRIDIDQDCGNRYIDDVTVLRVFRNSRFLRFEGKIHEILKNTAKRKPQMKYIEDITIMHTGYSASIVDDKTRRNLDILLAEQARRGKQPSDSFYLADCYVGLHEYEKAVRYARETIENDVVFLGMSNRPYLILIRCLILLKRPAEEIEEAIMKAKKRFPTMPEFPMLDGIGAWQAGDYLRAEKELRRGMELYKKMKENPLEDIYAGDQSTNLVPDVLWYLGRIMMLKGNSAEALHFFIDGLRLDRYNDNLLLWTSVVMADSPVSEAIACLNDIYDIKLEAEFLARKLAGTPLKTACLYYERQAGKPLFSDFTRYHLAKKAEAAAREVLVEAKSLVRLAHVCQQRCAAPDNELNTLLLSTAGISEEDSLCRERVAKSFN